MNRRPTPKRIKAALRFMEDATADENPVAGEVEQRSRRAATPEQGVGAGQGARARTEKGNAVTDLDDAGARETDDVLRETVGADRELWRQWGQDDD